MSAEEKSLLDLSQREKSLKKRLRVLAGDAMVYTPNIAKLRSELDQVQAEIQEWGTGTGNKVYRII